MPFVRKMFERMKNLINAEYYGYMNSDILLHPDVFQMLSLIEAKRKNGLIPNNFALVCRVKNSNMTITERNITSLASVLQIMEKGKMEKYRSRNAMVSIMSYY